MNDARKKKALIPFLSFAAPNLPLEISSPFLFRELFFIPSRSSLSLLFRGWLLFRSEREAEVKEWGRKLSRKGKRRDW